MSIFTDLPFIWCPKCECEVLIDDGLRENDIFDCSKCQVRLKVVLEETVRRVSCEFIDDPYESKSFLKLV